MKKIISLFLLMSMVVVFVPSIVSGDILPNPNPVPPPECSNLYWIDYTNKTCESLRQFCGTYIYLGLQTFNNKEDCLKAAIPKISYNFGTVTLRNGSRGEAVKELQRFLNQSVNWGLVVDGKLGPKTLEVVKTWQRDNDLTPDGLVGRNTKAKMNASVQ